MEEEGSEPQQQQQFIEKPEYGEVDGQRIKLDGLDYTLLRQQDADKNQNLISQIKNKLNIISGNVLSRKLEETKLKEKAISKQDIKIYEALKSVLSPNSYILRNKRRWKNRAHSAFFYVYDVDPVFGGKRPEIVEKRLGKVEVKEVFNHFEDQTIKQFSRLLNLRENDDKNIQNQEEQDDIFGEEGDSDDIFGDMAPNKNSIDIQIGKKLDFGLKKETDLFKQYQNKKRPEPLKQMQEQANKTEEDKYFFMRKSTKRANLNENYDDGYGQCYQHQGPSLRQLIDLKKQGIEYFGEQKQFKKKQRKPNLNKDYQKIQRIIQQKNKN